MNTKNKFFDSIEIVRHKELFDSSDMVVCVPTLGRTSLPDCIDSISEAFPKIPIVVSYDEPKEVSTLGNNRNKLILFCKGKKLIFNDDDVFPSEMGIGKIDGQHIFVSSREELELLVHKIHINLVYYYNKLFNIPNLIGASGGVYGNYIEDNPFLRIVGCLSPNKIKNLTKETYELIKTGKFYICQFNIGNSLVDRSFIGAHFLLDTRKVPLIPFYPFFRTQCSLYYTMTRIFYPNYTMYCLPYIFFHNPFENRNYSNKIFDTSTSFCKILLRYFLSRPFHTMDELIQNLYNIYNNFYYYVKKEFLFYVDMYESTLHNFKKINVSPSYVQEDVERFLTILHEVKDRINKGENVKILDTNFSFEEVRETIFYYIEYLKGWFKAWENR